MKFPRNARILRGHLDAAPYALVFFLLVMFILMASLVYTPGVKLSLPEAGDLPGTDAPTVAVAIDSTGRLYYQNQVVEPAALANQLRAAVRDSRIPIVLVVHADQAVAYSNIIQLAQLARSAGIRDTTLATLPRLIDAPAAKPSP